MNNKLTVINVLESQWYDDYHIKGSINVPLNILEEYASTLDTDQEIVVYCASYMCPASKKAWHMLNKLSFTNIWAYEGGANEWYHKKYPGVGTAQKDYLKTSITQPEAKEAEVKTISAEELKKKMEEQGLL